jgi:hypothetical protein
MDRAGSRSPRRLIAALNAEFFAARPVLLGAPSL